jgi:hypothetical protein
MQIHALRAQHAFTAGMIGVALYHQLTVSVFINQYATTDTTI